MSQLHQLAWLPASHPTKSMTIICWYVFVNMQERSYEAESDEAARAQISMETLNEQICANREVQLAFPWSELATCIRHNEYHSRLRQQRNQT
jgi:hypothetical protein